MQGEGSFPGEKRSTNVSKEDVDEETAEKLKGDTIGNTLYSQSFVLKTLLQLSDLHWKLEVEEDLCFLWDMTVEPEVCGYLFKLNYPSLACGATIKYDNNRFVEIIVGILANILCSSCEKSIKNEEISIILNVLDTDDSLVLIQVCRFVSAIAYMHENVPFITENVIEKLNFVLANSTNKELLLKTFEAISKLTVDFKLEENAVKSEIIQSALAGYETVLSDEQFDLEIEEKRSATKFLLEIFTNVCAYAERLDNDKGLLNEILKYSSAFVNNSIKIFYFYGRREYLFPVTDEFSFFISAILYIIKVLNIEFSKELLIVLHKVVCLLLEAKDECLDVFKSALELEGFLISKTKGDETYKIFKKFNTKNTCLILDCFKENLEEFTDFNVCKQLEYLENHLRHE